LFVYLRLLSLFGGCYLMVSFVVRVTLSTYSTHVPTPSFWFVICFAPWTWATSDLAPSFGASSGQQDAEEFETVLLARIQNELADLATIEVSQHLSAGLYCPNPDPALPFSCHVNRVFVLCFSCLDG
jgi:hypothetical protein